MQIWNPTAMGRPQPHTVAFPTVGFSVAPVFDGNTHGGAAGPTLAHCPHHPPPQPSRLYLARIDDKEGGGADRDLNQPPPLLPNPCRSRQNRAGREQASFPSLRLAVSFKKALTPRETSAGATKRWAFFCAMVLAAVVGASHMTPVRCYHGNALIGSETILQLIFPSFIYVF